MRSIGSRAKCEACGSGCSNALTSPRARWSLWSSRIVLCRYACRIGVRRRPLIHAYWQARRRQPTGRRSLPRERELRRLSHVEWALSPGEPVSCRSRRCRCIEAPEAERLGLVTAALDDIDWEDEIRVFLEERASFSPDALTGLEANLRFAGPETMESKIFARMTAWQNWIFQRPNAVGTDGALRRYGTGQKPAFDTTRV